MIMGGGLAAEVIKTGQTSRSSAVSLLIAGLLLSHLSPAPILVNVFLPIMWPEMSP